jgi:hypothetical protein
MPSTPKITDLPAGLSDSELADVADYCAYLSFQRIFVSEVQAAVLKVGQAPAE